MEDAPGYTQLLVKKKENQSYEIEEKIRKVINVTIKKKIESQGKLIRSIEQQQIKIKNNQIKLEERIYRIESIKLILLFVIIILLVIMCLNTKYFPISSH